MVIGEITSIPALGPTVQAIQHYAVGTLGIPRVAELACWALKEAADAAVSNAVQPRLCEKFVRSPPSRRLTHGYGWRPQGDSNPCYRRERAMSWASRRWGHSGRSATDLERRARNCNPCSSPDGRPRLS